MWTTHTLYIVFTRLIIIINRHTTGMTHVEITFNQSMLQWYPVIKHKTFSLPKTLFRLYLLQVFLDASLQLQHFFKTFLQQVGTGFLAPDSASAKHRNFFCLLIHHWFELSIYPLWKFPERFGVWLNGIGESSNCIFERFSNIY